MIKPKIRISEGQFFVFDCDFAAYSTIISPSYKRCFNCMHFYNCEICNEEFLKFYDDFIKCPKCGKASLDMLYVYIIWNLKEYVSPNTIRCCWCDKHKT